MYCEKYTEGVAKVRLSQLVPEHPGLSTRIGDIVSVDLDKLQEQPGTIIAGRITPETRDAMLRSLGMSTDRFRCDSASQDCSLPADHQVYCQAGSRCIETVRKTLGSEFQCTVRLYCIPPCTSQCLPRACIVAN